MLFDKADLPPSPKSELRQPVAPPALGADATQVVLFADGGCEPNPGTGGWGCVLGSGAVCRELGGGEADSTNNRMELMGIIAGLEALKRPCRVLVASDSQYVVHMMTDWINGWSRRGWSRQATKHKPPENLDLVQRLARAALRHQTTWHWVKGHAGHAENERCDRIAAAMIRAVVASGKAAMDQRVPRTVAAPPAEGLPGAVVWLTQEERGSWGAG
ncbi:MAG: ribonuclease HI [Deltaproteobacteria bacterium]|nr:ribonuclease HI [Deltaproteobacteria bacterium]